MRRRALLLAGSVLALGCASTRLPPPPAPAATTAGDFVPPDLDVVVRLDLGRVKATLGSVALSALSREVLARGGAGEDELLLEALLEADVVYLAYRPSALLAPLDRVLALQGRFTPLTRAPQGFGGGVDLGGDVRYWDRKSGSEGADGAREGADRAVAVPRPRERVARVYAIGERVRVFVSEAEVDAVERTLTGAGNERRLSPPEEGTLSLAARPLLLARLSGRGALRELLEDAKALQAVAELESDGVRLKLELVMGSAEAASSLARAAQPLVSRTLERVGGAELRAEGERVLLSARLSRADLAPALSCLEGASGSGCPW